MTLPRTAGPLVEVAKGGAALLRQQILDGLARTGTDPWLASDIADALKKSALSVRQACDVLAAQGRLVVVSRNPYSVRRA